MTSVRVAGGCDRRPPKRDSQRHRWRPRVRAALTSTRWRNGICQPFAPILVLGCRWARRPAGNQTMSRSFEVRSTSVRTSRGNAPSVLSRRGLRLTRSTIEPVIDPSGHQLRRRDRQHIDHDLRRSRSRPGQIVRGSGLFQSSSLYLPKMAVPPRTPRRGSAGKARR